MIICSFATGCDTFDGINIGAVQDAPGYVAAPPASDIGPLRGWNASAAIDQYGELNIDVDNDGPENVRVGGTTYACLKVTGTKDLGGYGSEFTAWLNPQTGSFVRMINTYTDVSGTTSMTYDLQSTSFAN